MGSNQADIRPPERWSRMTLRLPPTLYMATARRAAEDERPCAEVVRAALRAYLGLGGDTR